MKHLIPDENLRKYFVKKRSMKVYKTIDIKLLNLEKIDIWRLCFRMSAGIWWLRVKFRI